MVKPMLAVDAKDLTVLKYPKLVSPKIDGIRCLITLEGPVTRTGKPIPNLHIREQLSRLPIGLDGELVTGGMTGNFSQSQSDIMTAKGAPDFKFCVFDDFRFTMINEPFYSRHSRLSSVKSSIIEIVQHLEIRDPRRAIATYEAFLEMGYEGMMLRDPLGRYKQGRSTLKEELLLKWKPWADTEAVVLGFEEQQENLNEISTDAFGNNKRKKVLGKLKGKNTLGKFKVGFCEDFPDREFLVGTGEGLTDALRKEIWENQSSYLGRVLTFKYLPHGVKDLPRHPVFKGFRSEEDF